MRAVPRSPVLVRCPWCAARATVIENRFVCVQCGHTHVDPDARPGYWCGCCARWEGTTSQWFHGEVLAQAVGRCGTCGQPLAWSQRCNRQSISGATRDVACPGCGATTQLKLEFTNQLKPHDPVDRVFGLPLWLQAPCAGHILWAANSEHLDFLAAFISAKNRDVPQATLGERLPQWMVTAKNRTAVLRAITKLRGTLES